MKKHKALTISSLLVLCLSAQAAFARQPKLECKAQLARASESYIEILPSGPQYADLDLNETGSASLSLNFSLRGATDLVYRLDLHAQTKVSSWNSKKTDKEKTDKEKTDLLAFKLDAQLWDVKNNKMVAAKTFESDNIRTVYLLNKLLHDGEAIIAADLPSIEVREEVLKSENESVKALAQKGLWLKAVETALSEAEVHPHIADFASLHCILKN